MLQRTLFSVAFSLFFATSLSSLNAEQVSFHKQIRPIFQLHCQGCHQPAKRGGDFVMTSVSELLEAGESGEDAIIPGNPESSYLLEQITPENGEAQMPKGKPPLSDEEIELVRLWIEQGAKDDSPVQQSRLYDAEHPPVYHSAPVVTSIDFSPDGELLAVAGFHEVLLRSGDGSQLVGRLVGMAERIESIAFSPDGSQLAVAGGQPGRSGEVQVWNIEDQSLALSIPITSDTLYGVSWSPQGDIVIVGCHDNIVRGFDSVTGKQVFFNGAHDDWPLETVFSVNGKYIVSVGRDMSTKLYEFETERFVDNVTSITPGALKGGLASIARRSDRDEIAVAGADGIPRVYRMHRVTKRVIGDDANLLRRFTPMEGRLYAIEYSPDGKQIACGSSFNGIGQVYTFSTDFDFEMPEEIKPIVETVVTSQNAEQKKTLEDYVTKGTAPLTETDLPTGIYALDYHPDGSVIVAAGGDGVLWFIDPQSGDVIREILPVEIASDENVASREVEAQRSVDDSLVGEESLPEGESIVELDISPDVVSLVEGEGYVQLLVTGRLKSGGAIDLTRMANVSSTSDNILISPLKRVKSLTAESGELQVSFGDLQATVPVSVTPYDPAQQVSFIKDVNPVLSRLGCNQGTCHGAKDGKNGFKLSLRGYDPIFDVRSFADDIKSRRTNVASPDDSLMLLKASGAVPHVGGRLTVPGEPYYEVIRKWIAEGCQLDLDVPRVTGIELIPEQPVIPQIGGRQQIRVVATYSNGEVRDVTGEAFLESGNTEVAAVNRAAIVTAVRRGEAPVLARFEGSYAAATVTVMGDRSEFEWSEPESWSPIDDLVAEKWQRMKILPSGLCTDEEFIRRVYLDLTGLPPTSDDVVKFVNDSRDLREKRNELVEQLVGSEAYVEHWSNKWADMLQVNGKFIGGEGAKLFRNWIRKHVQENTPYDEFARLVLTASGSNKSNPAASYYKILREPDAMMENTTHLFLGVRFNCNKCHDHPFERWTQDQYYETAAFFAQVGLKRDPENKDGNLGGTAVEGAKPLWEVVFDQEEGEVVHDRTGDVVAPLVPFDRDLQNAEETTRREALASWITSAENDYFASSYVNRVWGYLMGVGLIEPLDDIRAGNPPSNPQLMAYLTDRFVESGFDVQKLMVDICQSRTYQLSIATNEWNADDQLNYSHAYPKRLPAEVLYDSVYAVTGSKMEIPGVPEGTRAAAIPDSGIELTDGFLANLGRPVRESSCECERSSELQLGPVMALMNGQTVSTAISQPGNAIEELVSSIEDDRQLVNEVFLRVLNRSASDREIDVTLDMMSTLNAEHEELVRELEEYKDKVGPIIAEKEKERQEKIDRAEQELAEYLEKIKDYEEKQEQERLQRVKEAQEKLDAHVASVDERLALWEQSVFASGTPWSLIEFKELKTTNGAKLSSEDDGAIFASGKNNKAGAYILKSDPIKTEIKAFKLEALTDDRLPTRGPGRAPNGNFVVSEFTVHAWPVGKPEEKVAVKLQNATADFSQGGYSIETAIDGKKPNNGNGWATSPKTGEDRFATFELAEPLNFEEGIVLEVTIDQNYQDKKHSLGKFRLSTTSDDPPYTPGTSKAITDILAKSIEDRSEEEQKTLVEFYNQQDDQLRLLKEKLEREQQPLPEDPRVTILKMSVEKQKEPLVEDPQLVRLTRAVKLSEEQLQQQRLTIVQDLTWALINSPAFLFNR
ncbi:WD domain, G-beta repeat [Thalassoglobus neptunius]|uniref:WD domain, G-beta repeat n=1 Tax=Thalassoglobus neptunius TaxID=1938619 RepID=A0A5C5VZI6_9PLAN|nr:DUF1549 domain-containing protein [Thalassoglobus neptunius]TWT43517.1 WD domain, G-beta repeat [Thalassoglobus neptunius]